MNVASLRMTAAIWLCSQAFRRDGAIADRRHPTLLVRSGGLHRLGCGLRRSIGAMGSPAAVLARGRGRCSHRRHLVRRRYSRGWQEREDRPRSPSIRSTRAGKQDLFPGLRPEKASCAGENLEEWFSRYLEYIGLKRGACRFIRCATASTPICSTARFRMSG